MQDLLDLSVHLLLNVVMGQVGNAHGLGLAVAWACVAQVGLFAACCIMGFLSGPVW